MLASEEVLGARPASRPDAIPERMAIADLARLVDAVEIAEIAEPMDERAFQEFYQETAGALRAYAVRVLGNVTPADDIVQEAYLRFLRAPPATAEPRRLRAFLFLIASNLIADHYRQRRRERAAPEECLDGAATSDPDVRLRVDMGRVFERLTPRQRQLMWLAYVEGAEHREIASALGLGERSVRVLLSRARGKLAQWIRQDSPGEKR